MYLSSWHGTWLSTGTILLVPVHMSQLWCHMNISHLLSLTTQNERLSGPHNVLVSLLTPLTCTLWPQTLTQLFLSSRTPSVRLPLSPQRFCSIICRRYFVQVMVFWVRTPCSGVVGYHCFRGPCWLHLWGEGYILSHHYTALQSRRPQFESSSCLLIHQ